MPEHKIYINNQLIEYNSPLEFERSEVDGFIGLRLQLSSELIFIGDAFETLYAIETSTSRCNKQTILIKRNCGSGFKDYFFGKFSMNNVKWDLSKCRCSFTPEVDDVLQCIIDNGDTDYNIIESNIFQSTAPIDFPFEFLICRNPAVLANPCNGENTTTDGWAVFYDNPAAPSGVVRIWWREVQITPCIAGNPQAPTGAGWNLYSNDCATTNTSKYVRNPVIAAPPFGDIAIGTCANDEAVKPSVSTTSFNLTQNAAPAGTTIIGTPDINATIITAAIGEFKIQNPRNSSNYQWSTGTGVILSGQGTDTVSVRFNTVGANVLNVQETTECGHINNDAHNVNVVVSLAPPALTVAPNVIGVSQYYENEILEYKSDWNYTGSSDNLTWSVVGGTIISGQGTDTIKVQTTNAANVTATVSLGSGSNNLVTALAVLPVVDSIISPTEICSGAVQTLYVPNHLGATYAWTVPAGYTIQSGQGTNVITVDSSGVAGVDSISVIQTLPIQPNLILVGDCEGDVDSFWYELPQGILYNRQRLLLDVLTDMIGSYCDDVEIISDFFEWNSPQPFNYVTGQDNKVKFLTISQKSDIKDPLSTEPASVGLINFNELREFLRCIFDVYPSMQGNVLRFEHISYYENIGSILNVSSYPETKGTNQYEYAKNTLPRVQKYEWMESRDFDFKGVPIIYNDADGNKSLCVGTQEELCSAQLITTDLKYIQDAPPDIANDGFVLMANGYDGTDFYVLAENGALSGQNKTNAHLSWANLHENYHKNNRVIIDGWLNNVYQEFLSARKIRLQTIIIQECCLTFEALQRIHTPLTILLNSAGEVESVKESTKQNTLEINLSF